MAKNKVGKLFDKTIVWGCSLNELDEHNRKKKSFNNKYH